MKDALRKKRAPNLNVKAAGVVVKGDAALIVLDSQESVEQKARAACYGLPRSLPPFKSLLEVHL